MDSMIFLQTVSNNLIGYIQILQTYLGKAPPGCIDKKYTKSNFFSQPKSKVIKQDYYYPLAIVVKQWQCDQLAICFVPFLPFTIMKICQKIAKSGHIGWQYDFSKCKGKSVTHFSPQPRCKNFPEVASKNCELGPDPEDSCCKVMTCPDPKSMDDLKPVGLPFDGCTYKNTTYKQVTNAKVHILKMNQPRSFYHLFQSFQANIITIFTANICEKMSIQYMVPGFEPGLPPKKCSCLFV